MGKLCAKGSKFAFSSDLAKKQKNINYYTSNRGRRGDIVVSVPDSRSRGLGLSPGRVIVLCSWARHFTLTVPLSSQEYKWVPANCEGNLKKCWGLIT